MINELDFLYISSWDQQHMEKYLLGWVKRYGVKSAVKMAMNFRRNLQKALARYSKINKTYDDRQTNTLMLIEAIYRIMGRVYVPWARKAIVNEKPWMAKYPQKVKILANGWWNNYVKTNDGAY